MTLVVLFKGKHACHQLLPTTVPVMMEPARWPLGLGRLHKSPTAAAFVLSCLWLTSEHVCACDTDTETAAIAAVQPPAADCRSRRLLIRRLLNQLNEKREKNLSNRRVALAQGNLSPCCSHVFIVCSRSIHSIVPLPSLSPSLSALLSPENNKSLRVSRLIAGSRHCHSAATWT